MTQFNPEFWLTSLQRALGDYVKAEIDAAIVQAGGAEVGLQVYEVVFDWPEADDVTTYANLPKSIIHFVLDDIDNARVGLGDDVAAQSAEFVEGDLTQFVDHEAKWHTLNFDVGIWASDQSGGGTARLVAYEMLYKILGTESGRKELAAATGGIEVIRFNGGRFVTDSINDIRMFRTIDTELVVRVSSRHVSSEPVIVADQEIVQNPNLTINEIPIA